MTKRALRCLCLVLGVVGIGGCFSPQFEDGKISCGADGSCPPGLQCVAGVCRSSDVPHDAALTFTLSVVTGGNGTGNVTSSPVGIDCGSDCTEAFAADTSVTLTATPTQGSQFMGWSGACSGTGTCTVTVGANLTVTANFAVANSLLVVKAGAGMGIVSSDPAGITCGSDCSEQFPPSTSVTLIGAALSGSVFDGWEGGGCSGTGPCVVTLDASKMVTATFVPVKHSLTVVTAGNGVGSVESNPAGIDCGADCSEAISAGTMVTLTATAATGSTFSGWSGGGCTGASTCTVTVNDATTVTATFVLTTYDVTVTRMGNGAGTITSTPAGINCGSDCTEAYNYNTMVTLNASPAAGSVFMGWTGGGCTGTSSCVVTATAAVDVAATFMLTTPTLTVEKDGSGVGNVASSVAGIDCGADCSEAYNYNTMITLTATPATGSTFAGWSGGGCTGTMPCTVTLLASTTVTASFTLQTRALDVTVMGTGAGTVSSIPAGINCSAATCSANFDYGTMVALTATAQLGSTFAGWSGGGCSGTGTCVVTMTNAQAVSATFTLSTHQLTVAKSGTGTGTVTSTVPAGGINCGSDCIELYGFGTVVTLHAVATTGSTFTGWSGVTGCPGTGDCNVTITTATTATANFALTTHDLTVSMSGNGNVSGAGINCPGDCSETYNYGTAVTLTATAAPGSFFSGWSGGGCSGTGTCVVSITTATSVTATFTLGSNSMTVAKSGNGSGTITSVPAGINCGSDCSEDFTNGTTVTLTATPATGSTFTGWSGGVCSGTGTCMVTIASAVTITANFTLNTYALTVTKAGMGAGSVVSSPAGINCPTDCTENYDHGTLVQLAASAPGGSTFAGWSGGGCSGTGTCVVTMTAATAVTATFNKVQYPLTVVPAGNGTGTVTSTNPTGIIACGADCSETVDSGTMVTLAATADPGSVFTGWSGACAGTGTCTVTVSAATSVTATFTLMTYSLALKINGTGSVNFDPPNVLCTADCTKTYNYGDKITLTASTPAGWTFTGWSGAGCTGTGTCDIKLLQNENVTATFKQLDLTLSVIANGNAASNGTVTSDIGNISCGSNCSDNYPYGTVVRLTASAPTGTTFTGWSGGGCSGTGVCAVTMDAAKTVTATFTYVTYAFSVIKTGTGTGTVSSSPSGINCGGTCTATFNYNTPVMLTATPTAGSKFVGWTAGACSGTSPTCTVTILQAANTTAQFDVIPPNYVFVTSVTTTGAITYMGMSGVAAADALCQARATAGGLPANTYKAFLSTASQSATQRLGSARGWVRKDGKPVADTVSNLRTNHLYYPIKFDELGGTVAEGVYAMTGTFGGGDYDTTGNCNDYTTTTGSVRGGFPSADSGLFTGYARPNCTSTMRLYCFGTDNAAVVQPPAVSARRAFTSNTGWMPGSGIASADMVCQTDAAAAGLSGTYLALLATTTQSAMARFSTGSGTLPWARPDNTLLAPTAAALATPGLAYVDASPSCNPQNTGWYANSNFLWSGANDLATVGSATSTCNNWMDGSSTATGAFGVTGFTVMSNPGAAFRGASTANCGQMMKLTCLQAN